MKFTFTPEHLVLADLFAGNMLYLIPNYQRPYSWDCIGKSEKNNQINTMWDDLIDFYNNEEEGEYFFGSMVMIEKVSRQFDVVDGQQRLTSLVLLFVAIKCFFKKIQNDKNIIVKDIEKQELEIFLSEAIRTIDEIIYNKHTFGLKTDRKVKIEKNAEFDYDLILTNIMECSENSIIDYNKITEEQKEIVDRYYKNRNYFINCIEKKFTVNGLFDIKNAEEINKFTFFLQYRLSFVRIKTPDFNAAYQIFEILNNRGLPLSNKDLFRSFIINEFSEIKTKFPDKYSKLIPGNKWVELEKDYSFTTDFIGRWVESYKGGQQKYSAFNDLKEIYLKQYKSLNKEKIEIFYDDIKRDLSYYTAIVNDSVLDKKVKYKIQFLKNSGNQRYTFNLLIALFRNLKFDNTFNSKLLEFVTQYERFVLFTILVPSKRFSSSYVYDAINFLNENDYNSAYEVFNLDQNQKNLLKELINEKIEDNSVAKLLIAKYIWYSTSKIKEDVIDIILNYEKATLEHIIPQKPVESTNWLTDFTTDFRKNYTYKLGNMTLLTHAINSKANNNDFSNKQKAYKSTLLGINEKIIEISNETNSFKISKIDENFIKERQIHIVECIIKDLEL